MPAKQAKTGHRAWARWRERRRGKQRRAAELTAKVRAERRGRDYVAGAFAFDHSALWARLAAW
jgi:hypothetical protein